MHVVPALRLPAVAFGEGWAAGPHRLRKTACRQAQGPEPVEGRQPYIRLNESGLAWPVRPKTSPSPSHTVLPWKTSLPGTVWRRVVSQPPKVRNHEHAVTLHFMHYDLCRIHQSLRVTPAMQAGITDHVWELEEIVSLMDYVAAKAA